MEIDDMSTNTIKKYLEKRKEKDKKVELIFEGMVYNFKINLGGYNNSLIVINKYSNNNEIAHFNNKKTIKALKRAIAKWEELENGNEH